MENWKEKYEQVLERAKKYKAGKMERALKDNETIVDYIFPELENPSDKQIRKNCMKYLDYEYQHNHNEVDRKEIEKCMGWLEKQEEREEDVRYNYLNDLLIADDIHQMAMNDTMVTEAKNLAMGVISKLGIFKLFDIREKDPCNGCNNIKGCVTCVNGDQWAHYSDTSSNELSDYEKFTGKLEPEFDFEVGDWIVATGKINYKVIKIDGFNITLVDTSNNEYVFDVSSLDDAYLWTIQDAKDGDVLAIDWIDDFSNVWEKIIIFKSLSNKNGVPYGVEGYGCTFKNKEKIFDVNVPFYSKTWTKNLHPATEEQCDLLFTKMKESGYVWDDNKKELKKIEQKPVEDCDMAIMLKKAFGSVGKKTWGGIEVKDILTWLEMQEEQKPTIVWYDVNEIPDDTKQILVECIKDDDVWYEVVHYDINTRTFILFGIPVEHVNRWAYVGDILTHSVTKTWTEEDEHNMQDIDSVLFHDKNLQEDVCVRLRNWLISLKGRVATQQQWKPTELQLDCLEEAIQYYKPAGSHATILILEILLEKLKKLKRE